MGHPLFFLMIAAIGFVSGAIIWAMEKPLRPFLKNPMTEDDKPETTHRLRWAA